MPTPKTSKPKLTNNDISSGFLSRYFVKHISRPQVYEVDAQQYRSFSNDPYYQHITLNWVIGGNDKDITGNNGFIIRGAEYQNTKIAQHYNSKMAGIANHLKNPLEFFSGTRLKDQPRFVAPTISYSNGIFPTDESGASDISETVWTLVAEDTIPNRGSDLVGLATYSPDNPLSSGWTSYQGGASNYNVRTFGTINANIANPAVIYSNVSFDHTNIRFYIVMGRYGTDRTGSGFIAGLYYNLGFLNRLYISVVRQTAGNSILSLVATDAVGVNNTLSTAGPDLGTNEAYLFIIEIANGIITVYQNTDTAGTLETSTQILQTALPAHLSALSQTQSIFWQALGSTSLISSHYYMASNAVWAKI